MNELFKKIDQQIDVLIDDQISDINGEIETLFDKKLSRQNEVRFGVVVGEMIINENAPAFEELQEIQSKINNAKNRLARAENLRTAKAANRFAAQFQELPVLGVLPKPLWYELCHKYGLYCFEHISAEGKTGVADRTTALLLSFSLLFLILPAIIAFSLIPLPVFQLVSGIVIVVMAWSMFMGVLKMPPEGGKFKNTANELFVDITKTIFMFSFFVGLFAFPNSFVSVSPSNLFSLDSLWGLLSLFGGIIAAVVIFLVETYLFISLTSLLHKLPSRLLVKILWPAGIDYKPAKDETPVSVKFKFQASEIFISTLCRLKELGASPKIATVSSAIDINKREAALSILSSVDPILYTIDGDFVIVHEQCGEFAAEQDIMKWVKKNAWKFSGI
ncbi:MAG: hypothetical protein WC456_02225 [Patescibacteria group bacterium]